MAKEISYEEAVYEQKIHFHPGSDVHRIENRVNPTHLLQVIRDMDRRISDLERKLEHNGRT